MLLSPPQSILSPYTTLFRSVPHERAATRPLYRRHTYRQSFRSVAAGRRDIGAGRSDRRRGQPGDRETPPPYRRDRKSTRLNSSHLVISYAVFCLKKNKRINV